MTYLKRSNVSARRGTRATLGVVLVLVVLFSIHAFFPRAYGTALYPVTSLFWKAEDATVGWFVNMGKMVQSKYRLIKENKRLSDEVAARDTSMLLLNDLRRENEELKNALHRSGKGNHILGVIVARPPVSPYDTLVIDIGEKDGVSVGDRVYTDGDTIIGDIAEVYAGESKVSLYSSPGRIVSVVIGAPGVETQATGRGGGNFMAKLPVEVGIEEGDAIVMPQIRSHTFGVVERILVDSSDSLQTILFKTPINIHQFRYVEVDLGA